MRLLRLALRLGAGQPVTSAYICETYGVSKATAKRDLVRLECLLPVRVELERGGNFSRKVMRARP